MRARFVIAWFGCALLAACGEGAEDAIDPDHATMRRPEVMVYAAISARDALLALESACEAAHGVDLVFNFGSSGALARQILAGGEADLFLPADELELDLLADVGLVQEGTRRALLSNRLVLVEPRGGSSNFVAPFDAGQLASPGIRLLSLGDPASTPVGRHAKAWLESERAWDLVAERVIPAIDARAALAAVESGGAQAGIVYRTDALRSSKVRTVHLVPREQAPPSVYPLAVLRGRANQAVSACAAYLASEQGLAVFAAHGFEPWPPVQDASK